MQIEVDFLFCFWVILIWFFSLGAYLQYYYNIGYIQIPTEFLTWIVGIIVGIISVKVYDSVKGG